MKCLLNFGTFTAALLALTPTHALTLTQWNFNSTPSDSNPSTGTVVATIGGGTASLLGGTTGSMVSGDANDGSSDPVTSVGSSSSNDSAWQTTTYPVQGTGDKSRGVQFLVNTTGFSNVVISWDQRSSDLASRFTQLQYTSDGNTYVDAPSGLFTSSVSNTWFNNRSVNLSGLAGTSNNANFGFRIVSTFASGTSAYAAANPVSNYGPTGNTRFDMVTVSATAVPEPGVQALLIAGLLVVGAIARKRP